jgi:hypothetical protein
MSEPQKEKASGSCRSADATHKNRMTRFVQFCASCQSCHRGLSVATTLLTTAAGAILVLLAITHLHDTAQLVALSVGATLLNGGGK